MSETYGTSSANVKMQLDYSYAMPTLVLASGGPPAEQSRTALPPAPAPQLSSANSSSVHVNRSGSVFISGSPFPPLPQNLATPAPLRVEAASAPLPATIRPSIASPPPPPVAESPVAPSLGREAQVLENLMTLCEQLHSFATLENLNAELYVESARLAMSTSTLAAKRDELAARAGALRHVQRTTNPLVSVIPMLAKEEKLLLNAVADAGASEALRRFIISRFEDEADAVAKISVLRRLDAQLNDARRTLMTPDTSNLRAADRDKLPLFNRWKSLARAQHAYARAMREQRYAEIERGRSLGEGDDADSAAAIAEAAERYVLPGELIERAGRLRFATGVVEDRLEALRRGTSAAEVSIRELRAGFARVRAADAARHPDPAEHREIATASALDLVAHREDLAARQSWFERALDGSAFLETEIDAAEDVWRPHLEEIRDVARVRLVREQALLAEEVAAAQRELGETIKEGYGGVVKEAEVRVLRAGAKCDAKQEELRSLARELASVSEATMVRSSLLQRVDDEEAQLRSVAASADVVVRVQRRLRQLWRGSSSDATEAVMFLSRIELATETTKRGVELYDEKMRSLGLGAEEGEEVDESKE